MNPYSTLDAKPVIRAGADLGEGAIWHNVQQALYWIDINGCSLHRYDPESGTHKTWDTHSRIGTVVPIEGSEDMLVALQSGIHRLNAEDGSLSFVANPISDPFIRFNDGKCDPSGRFWAGTFHMGGQRRNCALYRLDGDGSLHTMLEGVSISNGIVWTADKQTMYYIDTPTACVQAFDYDDHTGNISNGRVAFSIPAAEGDPDGMCIDADGLLWIAMWGGSSVNRYQPETGELLQKICLPAPHTTSCAFGGAALDTLYITSARTELSAAQLRDAPHSGDVFSVKPGASGVPSAAWRAR